jgi:hypothetical protein
MRMSELSRIRITGPGPNHNLRTYGRRPTKFTPERIQQIRDLVQQGTSREQIAALLDVTVGSLQVTCSRLGISLRRPGPHKTTRRSPEGPTTMDLSATAKFAIVLRHKGKEQTSELALPSAAITWLALEAQFQHTRIDELLGDLVKAATERDLFREVLNPR